MWIASGLPAIQQDTGLELHGVRIYLLGILAMHRSANEW